MGVFPYLNRLNIGSGEWFFKMSSYKNPPEFNILTNPYDRYIEELKAWCIVTELPKKKQGVAVALAMPENDSSGVRDKIFNDIKLDELNKDDGIDSLIHYMDNLFKRDELSEVYERYIKFDRFSRAENQKIENFILEFEKLYNRIRQKEMELPVPVLAFKLLDASGLSHHNRQLALTGVDYSNKANLFNQMKTSLKKFHGEQAIPESSENGSLKIVKSEGGSDQEVLYTRSNYRKWPSRNRGRGAGRYQSGNQSRYPQSNDNQKRDRSTNPPGFNGKPLKCKICESVMHLMRDCPHSSRSETSNVYESAQVPQENITLFTGADENAMCLLTYEARNAAVLDSACSSTVAGRNWVKCYLDSLNAEDRLKVERSSGTKIFRFGGGETKKSEETITLPGTLAGKSVLIKTDVVDSEIPLLLSKTAMKNAKIKLDFEFDKASIFGTAVSLDSTSCGHYCVPIYEAVETSLFTGQIKCMNEMGIEKILDKIHKQFAHPTRKKMKALLQDANVWDDEYNPVLDKIYQQCETCMKFSKTPPRPVVCLPLATSFNQSVAMDLKHWKNGIYILYLIDMFSRFTRAQWITRKDPEIIIDKIFTMWVGAGLGAPEKFIADNGGEFANNEYRDMAENLNIHVINTAAQSPWQNGICERNHAVVDSCLEKILEDNPKMSLDVALAWAINAKNCLQMWSGFSSYQIVFGQQPNLPNVMLDKPPALAGTTTSQTVATHINALHSGRKAFLEVESAERVRRALCHKIRANSESFTQGDRVYYKRQDSTKWKGPGIVIGQDGKVILVRHGSVYVRVSPNRILRVGEEF